MKAHITSSCVRLSLLCSLAVACTALAGSEKQGILDVSRLQEPRARLRQLLQTLPNVTHPDPVAAEAQCCSILQSIGFSVTPGIPVFIVDTNGQSVAGGGTGQDGQATNGNNGQNSQFVLMQMCTCSAGVANATYSGSGKIRLRGGNNSALRDTIRQYYIQVADNEALGGLPADNNWVLRGVQNDTLGLHEFLAMNLSRGLGWWAPRTQYTELFLIEDGQPINMNTDYNGIIVLEEHIDRTPQRLNLNKLKKDDDDITGGYILEYKHGDNPKGQPTINNTQSGLQWVVKYPDDFNATKLNYIQGYIDSFEAALFGPNFQDPNNGWRQFANQDSFVNFFLTTEIFKNAKHTYHGTSFANKDKGKKLDMGPTWSPKAGFGLCCGFPVNGYQNNGQSNGTSGGSAVSPSGWLFNICNETSRCDHQPAFPLAQYFLRLWEDPGFVQQCASTWTQMRNGEWSDSSVTAALNSVQASILPAGLRDFARWNDILLAPYGATDPTAFYNQAFTTLSSWTLQRLAWLDGAFANVVAAGNQIVPYNSSPQTATAG